MAVQSVEDASLYLIKNGSSLGESNELGLGFQFCRLKGNSASAKLIVLNQLVGLSFEFYKELFYKADGAAQNLLYMIRDFWWIDREYSIFHEESTYEYTKKYMEGLRYRLQLVDVEIENSHKAFFDFVDIKSNPNDKLPEFREKLHESPPFSGMTRPGHKFIRFSAFRYDRRITSDGGLLRGSYATSASDAKMVPNALAAVGRYALPNPVPAVHKFEIHPPPGTNIKYGTVTPQFNQSGGGAEVEFGDPLPPGSVVYKGTIPIW